MSALQVDRKAILRKRTNSLLCSSTPKPQPMVEFDHFSNFFKLILDVNVRFFFPHFTIGAIFCCSFFQSQFLRSRKFATNLHRFPCNVGAYTVTGPLWGESSNCIHISQNRITHIQLVPQTISISLICGLFLVLYET